MERKLCLSLLPKGENFRCLLFFVLKDAAPVRALKCLAAFTIIQDEHSRERLNRSWSPDYIIREKQLPNSPGSFKAAVLFP